VVALTVGINSYLTVVEASAYLDRRLRTGAWDAAVLWYDDAAKALMHACILLEGLPWTGDKTDPDQALAFPRDGETDVPTAIKDAQCELANWLLGFDAEALAHLSHAGVTRHMVGPVQMDLERVGGSFHSLPPIVQNLLGDRLALGATLHR